MGNSLRNKSLQDSILTLRVREEVLEFKLRIKIKEKETAEKRLAACRGKKVDEVIERRLAQSVLMATNEITLISEQQARLSAMRSRLQGIVYTKENAKIMQQITYGIERELTSDINPLQLARIIDSYESKLSEAEQLGNQVNTSLDAQKDQVCPPEAVQQLVDENKEMQQMEEAMAIDALPTRKTAAVVVQADVKVGGKGGGGGGEATDESKMQERLNKLS